MKNFAIVILFWAMNLAAILNPVYGGITGTTKYISGTLHVSGPIIISQSHIHYKSDPKNPGIIDGGKKAQGAFHILSGATDVTIDGITMQNFTSYGVYAECYTPGCSGIVVTNSTIAEISDSVAGKQDSVACWQSGAIQYEGNVHDSQITHNYIHDVAGNGILMNSGNIGSAGNISNNTIDSNVLDKTITGGNTDCGSIYIQDKSRKSSNITVTNNMITNWNAKTIVADALYCDDGCSGVLFEDNVVGPPIHGGGSVSPLLVHGGSRVTAIHNVFDRGPFETMPVAVYSSSHQGHQKTDLSRNVFDENIVISSESLKENWWYSNGDAIAFYYDKTTSDWHYPEISSNIWWDYTNHTAVNWTANFKNENKSTKREDTSPRILNPGITGTPRPYSLSESTSLTREVTSAPPTMGPPNMVFPAQSCHSYPPTVCSH